MFISYGDLEFEMEHIYRFQHRAVFDETGIDYLYDHIVIGVQAVWHPKVTRSNDITGTIGAPGEGNPAGVSIRDLRTYMMQPRMALRIIQGTEIMLDSPPFKPNGASRYVCDAKNGPQPLNFDIITWYGVGRTLVCRFEIETWVNDFCDPTYKTPSILSHRWTESHDIDQLCYTTRNIEGTVIFRKDLLVDHHDGREVQFPDDFRLRFFHPVPLNFKRERIRVTQPPDGTTYNYSYSDVEQPVNLGSDTPIQRIKASLHAGHNWSGLISLPTRHYEFNIHVWGRRNSQRRDLINACAKAAASLGFTNTDNSNGVYPYLHCEWDVDMIDRSVSLSMGIMANSAGVLAMGITNFFTRRNFGGTTPIEFAEDIAGITYDGENVNPGPSGPRGTRGTYLGRMIFQALSQPATVPRPPSSYLSGSISFPAEPGQLSYPATLRDKTARNSPLTGAGGY